MLKNMTIENIIKVTNGKFYGDENILSSEISGADLDSRKIESGYLFIATVGERVDGHSFIEDVLKKGAIAIIGEKEPKKEWEPYIQVESSFQALKDIAKFYRENLDIPVIGITGSVGKTGTKEAIATVLSKHYDVLKTAGNFNNEVGLPLTVLRIRDHHEVAVLEMGISDFGEMDRLSQIAQPDICVMTNIGFCHLENLKTQDGIYKAKSEMFNHMKKDGTIVLYGDDSILSKKTDINGIKPLFFGTNKNCDICISNDNSLGLNGTEFELSISGETIKAKCKLPGIHAVINSAAAALVGKCLKLTNEEICAGIEDIKPVNGRSNIINTEKYTVIDDCYNANPVSMKEALDLLNMANGRKVAVLGDMFELGTDSDKMHYSVGEYAAKINPDLVLLAGKSSKFMMDALKDAGYRNEVVLYENTEELIKEIDNKIKKGDSVLIKASHGMHFEKIVEHLTT